MASPFSNSIPLISTGLRSGAIFVSALGAVGLLAQFTHAPSILLALIASLVAAGVALVLAVQDPFDAGYSSLRQAGAHIISFLAALLGILVIVQFVPATSRFVCEPLVPWQLSIAIFGAFSMTWLSTAAKLRASHELAGPMINLAFFWIAPFYGFFHAPWFLAQTFVLTCDGRPWTQSIIVALGMIVAASAGLRTAIWMLR